MKHSVSLSILCFAFLLAGGLTAAHFNHDSEMDSSSEEMAAINETIPDDADDAVEVRNELNKLRDEIRESKAHIIRLSHEIRVVNFLLEKYQVKDQDKLGEVISANDQFLFGELMDISLEYNEMLIGAYQEQIDENEQILGYGRLTDDQIRQNIKNRPRPDVFTMMSMY